MAPESSSAAEPPGSHRPSSSYEPELAGGVGVLALHHVEVAGAEPGLLVGGGRGQLVGAGTVSSARPDSGVDSLSTGAGQVGAQHGGGEGRPARRRRPQVVAAQHERGRALVGRAEHEEVERLADDPRGEDLLDRGLLLVHGVGVGRPVAAVLHHHPGQVVLGHARGRGRAAGPAGAKKAGVAARPASSCQGSKNEERMMPLGIFSVPKTRTVSYCPARMAPAASMRAAPAAGAAGLDVDDGHARHAEAAEDLVARGHPAVGGAAERGLEAALAHAGLARGRPGPP